MRYQHHWNTGEIIELPAGKIVCAGLNYALHVKEMNSKAPESEPVLFIKPSTSFCDVTQPLTIPQDKGSVHHELEIAVLIGKPLSHCSEQEAAQAISGLAIALDLTLRDLQSELKKAGRPWEKSKGFDGSCPISAFVPIDQCPPLDRIDIALEVNNGLRQKGNSRDMLFPIPQLISEITNYFTLEPGDVVLTGTPEGVNALLSGDQLKLSLDSLLEVKTNIA